MGKDKFVLSKLLLNVLVFKFLNKSDYECQVKDHLSSEHRMIIIIVFNITDVLGDDSCSFSLYVDIK